MAATNYYSTVHFGQSARSYPKWVIINLSSAKAMYPVENVEDYICRTMLDEDYASHNQRSNYLINVNICGQTLSNQIF